MKELLHPSLADIQSAAEKTRSLVHHTPVLRSQSINRITGCELYFKCENFQKAGAFKFRGASHAVLSLTEDEAKNGVATHSSGNHAAALSLAASYRHIPAFVVMPENSPEIKKKAVAGYGAAITWCKPTLAAREEGLKEVIERTGAAFVHPYNQFSVICGQGTAALEFMEEITDLEILMTPVGGGGLLSGTATAARGLRPGIQVYGAEPLNADDARRSFKSRKLLPSVSPHTIADGLLTSLGDLTFSIVLERVNDIFTAREESIIAAMRMIWERMKIIVEPSAAVTLAVVLEHPEVFRKKKTGLILSGGNVDLEKLPF